MVGGDTGGRLLAVDPGQAEQSGNEVDMAGRYGHAFRIRRHTGTGEHQWYSGGLVEGVAPLLDQTTVGSQEVTVVRCEHNDRVVGHAALLERLKYPVDGSVDQFE